MDDIQVEIIRSSKRQKTVAARMVGPTMMRLYVPDYLSEGDVGAYVDTFKERFIQKRRKEELNSQESLRDLAEALNKRYFNGVLFIQSVEYVTNQRHQFGSCSCADGRIRIADGVALMPPWVREYVVVHELAHLLEPSHNKRFQDMVNRYPLAERARGFLIAKGLEMHEIDNELMPYVV